MAKKILLGSFEIPGWGGANTAAYNLFETMREDGLDVHYLSLVAEHESDYLSCMFGEDFGNPKRLTDVHHCILDGPVYHPHPKLAEFLQTLSPDLLIGVGFIAALLMKRALPGKRLIFLTSGCQQMKNAIVRREVKDFIRQKRILERMVGRRPRFLSLEEKEAVYISDLIMTHSDTTLLLYRYYFPLQTGKIYPNVIWFAEWIYKEALNYSAARRHFEQRDIDVLFVANSWDRPEKNYPLVREIVSRLRRASIHIVGEAEKKLNRATHHGLVVERERLFSIMGRAKTIVCPSLFDAAPGILFEAAAMECNIVASRNCGNWQLCHEQLLVEPFDAKQFLQKISLSLTARFEDNMAFFLEKNSYEDLLETISVI